MAFNHSKQLITTNTTNLNNNTLLNENNIKIYLKNKLILHYINIYAKCPELPRLIERSQPYIGHIINELNKRNLPKELSLLPIIESSYRIQAVSSAGATGIWQISYAAGKRYGLINNNHKKIQDERHDLVASTDAALSYLEFLYQKFNQDWPLALAAYNAGEGRVSRAINQNKFTGVNTDYWHLTLPTETSLYVPKLIALAIIFNNPNSYNLKLNNYFNLN